MKSATDDIDAFAIPGFREPVNCFTHFLAVLVFFILSFYLIRRGRGSWLRTASLCVMAFCSVFLLSMSAVYHLLGLGTGRDVMLITCILLWRRYGFCFVKPLVWGGVAYSLGAVILAQNRLILIPGVVGAHEVWHLAVVAGLGLHWKFVFKFAHGPPHTPVSCHD